MSSSNTEKLESFLTIVKTISKNNNQPAPLHLKSLLGSHNKPETKNLKQTLEKPATFFQTNNALASLPILPILTLKTAA